MTREKFVEDPFQPGQIMYKTGDLARWTHDDELELAGRKDNQVKVRGYRIELDEIKKQMLLLEGVREAVIVPGANQEQATVLCAYFTANRSIPLDEIRVHLGVELPEYMIPTHFMQLDTLPLTGNGKWMYVHFPNRMQAWVERWSMSPRETRQRACSFPSGKRCLASSQSASTITSLLPVVIPSKHCKLYPDCPELAKSLP